MLRVVDTKIKRTQAPYIFLLSGHVNSQKSDFLGKSLRTHKFSTGKFFGATTHRILTHSAFRECSRFGWPSLRFEVTAAHRPKPGSVTKKSEVSRKINTFVFLVRSFETNSTCCPSLDPIFYSFQSNQTKNTKSVQFSWHRICIATYLETRVNFGLKDTLPPFAIHILNNLDMRIHQVPPKIYHTY